MKLLVCNFRPLYCVQVLPLTPFSHIHSNYTIVLAFYFFKSVTKNEEIDYNIFRTIFIYEFLVLAQRFTL
jgi:hypothetical protein